RTSGCSCVFLPATSSKRRAARAALHRERSACNESVAREAGFGRVESIDTERGNQGNPHDALAEDAATGNAAACNGGGHGANAVDPRRAGVDRQARGASAHGFRTFLLSGIA